jgi:hypothetical protein
MVANIKHPHLREWLKMRVWCFYSSKRKEASSGQEEDRRCTGGAAVGANRADGDIPW